MSAVKWLAALALSTLPVSALADPLVVHTSITGQVTGSDNRFSELGGQLQPGTPLTVNFVGEFGSVYPTADPHTFSSYQSPYFYDLNVAAGGNVRNLWEPTAAGPQPLTWITLQDDVRNTAGDLIDVFELHTGGRTDFANVTYWLTTHLEYAATTFQDVDAWSILALEQAPLLAGSISMRRVAEGWDATFVVSNAVAEVNDFNVQFDGPGAQVPAVPEPGRYDLLLAGLAGLVALRRIPVRYLLT